MNNLINFCVNSNAPEGCRRWIQAVQPIKKGTLLYTEQPLFAVHSLLGDNEHDEHVLPSFISPRATSILKSNDSAGSNGISIERALVAAVEADGASVSFRNRMRMAGATLEHAVHVNLFLTQTQGMRNIYGAALYENTSSANHSCRPSATFVFGRAQEISLIACRDLEVGEEVTIAYVEYGENCCAAASPGDLEFECYCSLCASFRLGGIEGSGAGTMTVNPKIPQERMFMLTLEKLKTQPQITEAQCLQYYRLTRLLMAQKEMWWRFKANQSIEHVVVQIGLDACRAAVRGFSVDNWKNKEFVEFFKDWHVLFSSCSLHNQRWGVLLCQLVYRFLRFTMKQAVAPKDVHEISLKSKPDGITMRDFNLLPRAQQVRTIREFSQTFRALVKEAREVFVGQDLYCLEQIRIHLTFMNASSVWQLAEELFIKN